MKTVTTMITTTADRWATRVAPTLSTKAWAVFALAAGEPPFSLATQIKCPCCHGVAAVGPVVERQSLLCGCRGWISAEGEERPRALIDSTGGPCLLEAGCHDSSHKPSLCPDPAGALELRRLGAIELDVLLFDVTERGRALMAHRDLVAANLTALQREGLFRLAFTPGDAWEAPEYALTSTPLVRDTPFGREVARLLSKDAMALKRGPG